MFAESRGMGALQACCMEVHDRNVTNQQDIYTGSYTTPAPL